MPSPIVVDATTALGQRQVHPPSESIGGHPRLGFWRERQGEGGAQLTLSLHGAPVARRTHVPAAHTSLRQSPLPLHGAPSAATRTHSPAMHTPLPQSIVDRHLEPKVPLAATPRLHPPSLHSPPLHSSESGTPGSTVHAAPGGLKHLAPPGVISVPMQTAPPVQSLSHAQGLPKLEQVP